MLRHVHLNRTQLLVLGFFALAWVNLLAILVAVPEIYDQALQLPPDNRRLCDFTFLAAVSAFMVIFAVGILRRWHWSLWWLLSSVYCACQRPSCSSSGCKCRRFRLI